MASRALDALLAEIDPLSYRQRLRLLAGRARTLSGDGVLARLEAEPAPPPHDLIQQTALALARRDGLAHGLPALSLARCVAATPSRWTDDRDSEILRLLRRHAHPMHANGRSMRSRGQNERPIGRFMNHVE